MFATLLWATVAALGLILEMVTGTMYLLVLGISAGVTALYSVSAPDAWGEMLLVFTAVGAAQLFCLKKRKKPEPIDVSKDIGSHVEVTADLGNQMYRVRYQGTDWTAKLTEPLESDSTGEPITPTVLKVMRIEGMFLICRHPEPVLD